MPSAPPTVSVVMAVYDGEALLPATLRSLERQTFPDWELVAVDDASTDGTLALLRGWPDRRIRAVAAPANGGPVLARNMALAHARGRYVAALDADDLCRPDRFARQVAHLDAHPRVVGVGAAAASIGAETGAMGRSPHTTPALVRWLLHVENPLVWSSMMLRGDAVRALAPFTRPERLYAEDFDLYHRLLGVGELARIDRTLVDYRVHAGNISERNRDRMDAVASAVLADAHRPLFGDRAERAAALISRHLMLREPVPDRATLIELGQVLGQAQARHLGVHRPSRDDRRLIRWETARRWAHVGRTGLRAGTLALSDVLAVRPDHLGLGYAGLEQLLLSRAVGGARRVVQTFAA